MLKIEDILTRKDGTQVKIVAEWWTSPFRKSEISNYFFHRPSTDAAWEMISDSPYVENPVNRRDLITAPEIFRTNAKLAKKGQESDRAFLESLI